MYNEEETRAIGQWALEKGIFVLTDEIYEHLTYDGAGLGLDSEGCAPSWPIAVILNGVAKTYAMTGWRVG